MVQQANTGSIVREIKRKTGKKYTSEEKIRIVLEGLRGEEGIAEICRREGIHANMSQCKLLPRSFGQLEPLVRRNAY